jgi:hypothetical protein
MSYEYITISELKYHDLFSLNLGDDDVLMNLGPNGYNYLVHDIPKNLKENNWEYRAVVLDQVNDEPVGFDFRPNTIGNQRVNTNHQQLLLKADTKVIKIKGEDFK